MKTLRGMFWISPLVLLIAGCAAPVAQDHTIAEWQSEGLLPPTGRETTQVYQEQPVTYPSTQPRIIVQTDQRRNASGDLALADAIREQVEYDRGLAPSLRRVTIEVQNGRIVLRGSVPSDLDARVIVDDLRNVTGVTRITDNLEINPDLD